MRRLILLRHTKSDWPDGIGDHERPLAKRGRRAGLVMGSYIAQKGLLPDIAIVSTARRTQETWELVRPAFASLPVQRNEPRIYEAPVHVLLDVIREVDEAAQTLLMVGHNPGFQNMALDLIGEADQADIARLRTKFPTGGLVVVDLQVGSWAEVAAKCGRLELFETPRSVAGGYLSN